MIDIKMIKFYIGVRMRKIIHKHRKYNNILVKFYIIILYKNNGKITPIQYLTQRKTPEY